jgi:large subunit ribosomal protein L15
MIHTLPSPKTKSAKTQVGRGIGSGHGGHTAGRGTKGQKSRSGYTRPRPGFEGGQMPLSRRLPKLKGFNRGAFRAGTVNNVLKLSEVAETIKDGKVTVVSLVESGMILPSSKKVSIKILFDKDINQKLTIEGIEVSESVKAAVEKAGGSVQ